uniref:FH2 domain-containing protein n=1 Tax=Haemonchus contortus TaxID=6289 RepID=A0A7I4Y677_HAECO
MRPARRVPQRGGHRSLPGCRECMCPHVVDEIPPDPTSSTVVPSKQELIPDRCDRCLLNDIDPSKLSSALCGLPAGRGTALLLQALRQQVSVAASPSYSKKALSWIIDNDVLLLKARKQSLFVRILQADVVDSRDQMARLINTIVSFPAGREYFNSHLRLFLSTVVPVLRGRRLPSSTQEQLIASLQKASVRQSCQRELLQCGMLEWVVNFLESRNSLYATEYACALAINLSLNVNSHSLQLRFADTLAATACTVLNRETHGLSCSLYNAMTLVWLGCSRVRLRAKETRLYDVLRTRYLKKLCPLCDLHVPYLLAVISGEAENVRVPQAPSNDGDVDNAGESCEREIDATDPLRPTTNELSGAKLLLRKAIKELSPDVQATVPGQVLRNHKVVKTTHDPRRARSSEQRLGTAASQHTFVVETERRRPLLLPVGLTEGALEYRKTQEALRKAREQEEKRLQREQAEREAAEARERERSTVSNRHKASRFRQRLYRPNASARKPPALKKDTSESRENLSSQDINKAKRSPIRKKLLSSSNDVISAVVTAPTPTPLDETAEASLYNIEDESQLDYQAVFGSRPKVARTPDGASHRGNFSR